MVDEEHSAMLRRLPATGRGRTVHQTQSPALDGLQAALGMTNNVWWVEWIGRTSSDTAAWMALLTREDRNFFKACLPAAIRECVRL